MNAQPSLSEVVIVRTGSANLASVAAAITRLGSTPQVTDDPDIVRSARAVVLPGVGAFGPAMDSLRQRGLDGAVRDRANLGRPLLAICLGMQLLCRSSEESPGAKGLGVIPTQVRRFGPGQRVPQMGWNRVQPAPEGELLRPAWMYFAHSYRVESGPSGWMVATTEYGDPFVSALERGSLLACQFHPELSGKDGHELIGRWLARATREVVPQC